jgi:hypothetical protein
VSFAKGMIPNGPVLLGSGVHLAAFDDVRVVPMAAP